MAKVVYLGDPRGLDGEYKTADPGRLSLFGFAFTLGAEVEVPDNHPALAKFSANSHFKVTKGRRRTKAADGDGLDADQA